MDMGGRLGLGIGATVGVLAAGAATFLVFFSGSGSVTTVERVRKEAPAEIASQPAQRTYHVTGVVGGLGAQLDDAVVTLGNQSVTTDATGEFAFENALPGTIVVERPGYLPLELSFDGSNSDVAADLDPRVIRGIRVVPSAAASDAAYQNLIDLAGQTSANAFIFDTKADHDGGVVYYDSTVAAAVSASLVNVVFDAEARVQQAHEAGLYTITRIPVFLDPAYAEAVPAHVLAGEWLDPQKREFWEYPLGLAVEACEMGFDEIQFDYVRYPSGSAATKARSLGRVPDETTRVANIRAFLEEASVRLHAKGCTLSADIFGIVNAIENDQGIGQLVEEVSAAIDVYSPMIYPEQWSDGWFGIDSPATSPNALVAAVLDSAMPRVAPGTVVRPWLQSYYYTGDEILAGIAAAEARGLGWLLWNSPGNYSTSGIPAGTTGAG